MSRRLHDLSEDSENLKELHSRRPQAEPESASTPPPPPPPPEPPPASLWARISWQNIFWRFVFLPFAAFLPLVVVLPLSVSFGFWVLQVYLGYFAALIYVVYVGSASWLTPTAIAVVTGVGSGLLPIPTNPTLTNPAVPAAAPPLLSLPLVRTVPGCSDQVTLETLDTLVRTQVLPNTLSTTLLGLPPSYGYNLRQTEIRFDAIRTRQSDGKINTCAADLYVTYRPGPTDGRANIVYMVELTDDGRPYVSM